MRWRILGGPLPRVSELGSRVKGTRDVLLSGSPTIASTLWPRAFAQL